MSTFICTDCQREVERRSPNHKYCDECASSRQRAAIEKDMHGPRGRYRTYLHSAKRRGHKFEITFEDFMEYWDEPCTYCGSPIEGIGLDRVDSEGGYVDDNLVPCCSICNYMKQGLTVEVFLDHVKKIARRI